MDLAQYIQQTGIIQLFCAFGQPKWGCQRFGSKSFWVSLLRGHMRLSVVSCSFFLCL